MRVPADHLVAGDSGDVLDGERSVGVDGTQVGVKQHLIQNVPEFLDHVVAVARFDGVDELVALFNQILEQRLVCLFAIPRAAVLAAQPCHHGNQGVEFGVGGFTHVLSP